LPRQFLDLLKLIGSISDKAAFLEALEYGHAYRKADAPIELGED
jgi:hypothetical protein